MMYIFQKFKFHTDCKFFELDITLIQIRELIKLLLLYLDAKFFHVIKVNFYELMPDTLKHFDQKSKLRKTERVLCL